MLGAHSNERKSNKDTSACEEKLKEWKEEFVGGEVRRGGNGWSFLEDNGAIPLHHETIKQVVTVQCHSAVGYCIITFQRQRESDTSSFSRLAVCVRTGLIE